MATILASGEVAVQSLPHGERQLLRTSDDSGDFVFFEGVQFSPNGRTLSWYVPVAEVVQLWGVPPSSAFTSLVGGPGYALSPNGESIAFLERVRDDRDDLLWVTSLEGLPMWSVPMPADVAPGRVSTLTFGPASRTVVVDGFLPGADFEGLAVVTLG